jgi:hypothetical protein
MLVDMVPLRSGNQVRPRADVVADTPTRGELELTMSRGRWNLDRTGDEPDIKARLTVASRARQELVLHNAIITKMRGDSFLVYGTDVVCPVGIGSSSSFPQVWWCRLVRGAADTASRPKDPRALALPG